MAGAKLYMHTPPVRETGGFPRASFPMMNESMQEAARRVASLYQPEHEHDACGVGFIADISGERSNQVLRYGMQSLCNLGPSRRARRRRQDRRRRGPAHAASRTRFSATRSAAWGTICTRTPTSAWASCFLPHDNAYAQARAKAITEEVLESRGLFLFGWREVPTNINVLGDKAQLTMPRIEQVLVGKPWGMSADEYERRLFLARNEIEKLRRRRQDQEFLHRARCPAGSSFTRACWFPRRWRSSTATSPTRITTRRCASSTSVTARTRSRRGRSGSPSACLGHNGEINTVRGNRNWMHAREAELSRGFLGRGHRPAQAHHPAGRLGFRQPRQRAGSPRDERARHPARHDDARAPGVARQPERVARAGGVLRVPRLLQRAVGRPGGAGLQRRPTRSARAWTATACAPRATSSPTTAFSPSARRSARSSSTTRKVIEKGRLGPGEMIAVDTVNGQAPARRRHQGAPRRPAALPPVARRKPHPSRRPRVPRRACRNRRTTRHPHADRAAGRLRLHQRGTRRDPQAHAARRRGAVRVDGRRHRAGRALAPAAAALHVFLPALRAGDEPAHRPVAREAGHVAQHHHGLAAQPVRRDARARAADLSRNRRSCSSTNWPPCARTTRRRRSWRPSTRSGRWSDGADGLEGAVDRLCAEVEAAVDDGCRLVVLSDRGVDHAHVPVPMLLAMGGGASSPHPRRQADAREHHLRDRRGARRAPDGLSHRLRREQRRALSRVRDVPRDHRKDARRGPARPTRRRSRLTARRWRAASSRSCRRWASPCSPATGARRFSRPSG